MEATTPQRDDPVKPDPEARDDASSYWEHFGFSLEDTPESAEPDPAAVQAPPGLASQPDSPDLAEESPNAPHDPESDPATDTAPVGDSDRPRRRFAVACLAVAAGIVVLAVAVGVLLPHILAGRATDDQRGEVSQVTRQMMTNLVTLHYTSAQADVNRLLDGATGTFRQQFGGAAATFRNVIEKGKVNSTGQVTEVGVQSVDDNNATVLAAVRAHVANSDAPQGEERNYRMRVSLAHQDGRWLVSDVSFVP